MSLSDTTVRNAKPAQKPRKLSDGGGLFLLIQPAGGKLWRMAYRFGGKQRTLAMGVYPDVSLGDARDGRKDAKKLLAQGIDPSSQRKLDRQVAAASAGNTFRVLAEELLAKRGREGASESTLNKNRWLLSFAIDVIGDRPISEITAPEGFAKLDIQGGELGALKGMEATLRRSLLVLADG